MVRTDECFDGFGEVLRACRGFMARYYPDAEGACLVIDRGEGRASAKLPIPLTSGDAPSSAEPAAA